MKKIILLVLIPCIAVLVVQLGLAVPETRELFTKIDEYEDVSDDGASQTDGEITLYLSGGIPSDNIVIYYNARQVARFSRNTVTIPIKCDGLLEIRNDTNSVITVEIRTTNCKTEKLNSIFPKGIKSLCRIFKSGSGF